MDPAADPIEAGFKTALAKARHWCASEERCISDIRLKLMKLDCPSSDISKIIELVSEEGFINEQRYANSYVSGKFRILKWGKIKIASGLRMKKIPEMMITNALKRIEEPAYRNCLETLIKKKEYELKNLPAEGKRQKIVRFALQKGFESEIVYEIIRSIKE
jgi:regulatory protein